MLDEILEMNYVQCRAKIDEYCKESGAHLTDFNANKVRVQTIDGKAKNVSWEIAY